MTSKKRLWGSIAAIVLVPLLAVTALLGLTGGRADPGVSAAVVNLDQAVTVNGQYVPMGRQLAAAMVEREGDNIDWTLADAASAAAGLKTGEYSAVVTIPKGFSAAATSFSANDAATAEQATIAVQVSGNAPVTDSAVAQEISRLAIDTINSTLTGSYLDGIYVGFNTVGEQFATIVDGATQLADGASELADGTEAAAQGGAQLKAGMFQLSDNGPKLVVGGEQLVAGIGDLKTGTAQLSDGAGKLADGITQFAQQTPQLVDGVSQLATGADQLLGQVPAFANGSAAALGGVSEIRGGLDQMIAQLDQAGPGDTGGLDQLTDGAAGLTQGADGIAGGLKYVSGKLGDYGQGDFDQVAQGAIGQAAGTFQCEVQDPALCGQLAKAYAQGVGTGFATSSQVAAGMLTTPDASGQSLVSGADSLATGAGQFEAGLNTAVDAIAEQTATQMGQLKGGLTQIRDGAATLEEKTAPLVAGAPALAAGATQLNEGIQQLNDQVGALPAGVNQLSDGASQLAAGVDKLDAGVGTLRDGAATYVDGVRQYTEGVGSAASGTAEFADGLVQLSAGTTKLSDGLSTFATELAKGADQVPSYSQGDREKLAKVVASPVQQSDSLISSGAVPLASLLLLTGLWLGALAASVAFRPVPEDVVSSSAPSAKLWWRSLRAPLAVVAALGLGLGVIGGVVLDLGIGRTLGLMALLAVLGASFVLANHALSGWLGNIGRAVSLLLLVVTVGLGVSSALAWLGPVGTISPLHNGFTLVRTWLSDGTGEIGIATVSVLMFVIAGALSYLAIATRRRVSADAFRKGLTRAA